MVAIFHNVIPSLASALVFEMNLHCLEEQQTDIMCSDIFSTSCRSVCRLFAFYFSTHTSLLFLITYLFPTAEADLGAVATAVLEAIYRKWQ
jgi:hypothetical protein